LFSLAATSLSANLRPPQTRLLEDGNSGPQGKVLTFRTSERRPSSRAAIRFLPAARSPPRCRDGIPGIPAPFCIPAPGGGQQGCHQILGVSSRWGQDIEIPALSCAWCNPLAGAPREPSTRTAAEPREIPCFATWGSLQR